MLIFENNLNRVWAFLSLKVVVLDLLNDFLVNMSVLDYLIDRKVFLKLLLNWDKIFLIDMIEIIDDDAFMLLVENEELLGGQSWKSSWKPWELILIDNLRKPVYIAWFLELTGVQCF